MEKEERRRTQPTTTTVRRIIVKICTKRWYFFCRTVAIHHSVTTSTIQNDSCVVAKQVRIYLPPLYPPPYPGSDDTYVSRRLEHSTTVVRQPEPSVLEPTVLEVYVECWKDMRLLQPATDPHRERCHPLGSWNQRMEDLLTHHQHADL